MKRKLPALFFVLVVFGQQPPTVPPAPGADVQLPNGRSQRDEILRAEYKKNLEDATTMAKLAEEVSEDIEKDDRYIYSVKTMKKLDEIEKLTKAIRGRLKKF